MAYVYPLVIDLLDISDKKDNHDKIECCLAVTPSQLELLLFAVAYYVSVAESVLPDIPDPIKGYMNKCLLEYSHIHDVLAKALEDVK